MIYYHFERRQTHAHYIYKCMHGLSMKDAQETDNVCVSERIRGQSNKNKRERAFFFFFSYNLGCLTWACTNYLKSKNHTSPKTRCQGS